MWTVPQKAGGLCLSKRLAAQGSPTPTHPITCNGCPQIEASAPNSNPYNLLPINHNNRCSHRYLSFYLLKTAMGLAVKMVWDPYKVLDLDPNVRSTCVGYAPSMGRECHNPVCLADRERACDALDVMAGSWPTITPASLEKLGCLLLCKYRHQNQKSKMVEKWTQRIKAFQDLDQDTKRSVSQINQRQYQVENQYQVDKTIKELLSNLAQRDQEAEKLREQLSKAQKAEEEALQAKAGAEQMSQYLSIQLDHWKRLVAEHVNRDSKLRSEKENLEAKLCSRELEHTDARKSGERLTEELALVRDQLGEMLCNPPPAEPWWAINCELSSESTYNITAKVREAFAENQSSVKVAQQQVSIKEKDNSTLQLTLASAQAETETTKQQLSAKETAYTTLQQRLASAHARLGTQTQQLLLGEETLSKAQQELTSVQEVARTTKQQLTHQIRVDRRNQVEASRAIAEMSEIVRVERRRGEDAERRIAADEELFCALRLGVMRVVVCMLVVGALRMLDRV